MKIDEARLPAMNIAVTILIYLLEAIFAIGLIGCVFVLILATIDDVKVLFHREQPLPPTEAAPPGVSQPALHSPNLQPQPLRQQLHPQSH